MAVKTVKTSIVNALYNHDYLRTIKLPKQKARKT
jgi:hypothetical protein